MSRIWIPTVQRFNLTFAAPAVLLAALFVAAALLPGGDAHAQGTMTQRPSPDFTSAQGRATQLPVSDFTSAQGTTNVFFTPDPDLIAWSGRPPEYLRLGWMDFAGVADKYLVSIGKPSLGTTTSGSLSRMDMGGGLVEYHLQLHTDNALAWCVSLFPDFTLTNLFGAHAFEVAAGATPALGSCNLAIVWRQNAGTPIADITASTNVDPVTYAPPGFQLVSMDMHGTALGPLHTASGLGPEGTSGRMVISQAGSNLHSIGKGNGNVDGFPAEVMDLRVVGRGTVAPSVMTGSDPSTRVPAPQRSSWGRIKQLYR